MAKKKKQKIEDAMEINGDYIVGVVSKIELKETDGLSFYDAWNHPQLGKLYFYKR